MTNEWSDYIAHHGVLGMKWGVHRYRKQEGGFTKRGLKKLDRIASSEKKQKKETNLAKMRIAENSSIHIRNNDSYGKALARLEKRGKGESKKAKQFRDLIKAGNKAIDRNDKLLKDIDSGKLKAGRDFINQLDFNYNLGIFDTVTESVKFSNPKHDVSSSYMGRYRTPYKAR